MNTLIKSASLLLLGSMSTLALEWPQYRGPYTNGVTPEKITKPWSGAAPKELWRVPCTGGFSSFSVNNGRAFTLVLRDTDGVSQEAVLALDAKTGKELWSAPLSSVKYDGGGNAGTGDNKGGDGPRSTPTAVENDVFVLSSALVLISYDAATGKVNWKKDLIKEHAGRNIQWQNAASPLYAGKMLYVGGGGPGESLLCISPKTGDVVWKAFDERITHATPVAATIQGQQQVIFFLQSGLLAVEPNTGKELWRYKFDFKISTAASPVVIGDIVYCSAGYGVGGGAVRISKEGMGLKASEIYRIRGDKEIANHWSTPVAYQGHLYGMFQFKEYGGGPVKAVDAQTGNVKWTEKGFGPGNIILADKQLIALSDAGELVLIDPTPTGYKEAGRAKILSGKCWSTPVLSNGRIFARSTTEAVCVEVGQ